MKTFMNCDDFRSNQSYVLEINMEDKQYIEVNRKYEYIGHHTQCLTDIVPDHTKWKRTYLYNDGNKPWIKVSDYNTWYNKKENLIKSLELKIYTRSNK